MFGYYAYREITLKNQDWVLEYLRNIGPFIVKNRGVVLSRSINMRRLEGEIPLPTNVILIGFPSKEDADAFFGDAEYQPLRSKRVAGSISLFTGFPAEDLSLDYL